MTTVENDLRARLRRVGHALKTLQRTVRLHRLYGQDHPAVAKADDETAALLAALTADGPLEVELDPEGLVLDDRVVVPDSGQSTDLAGLLHPEGVRTLTFEAGVSRDEVADFCAILAAPYPEDDGAAFEDDVLTALWRRDFQGIQYKIEDQLSASAVRTKRDASLAPVANRIEGLVAELRGVAGAAALDVGAFLAELLRRTAADAADDQANWSALSGAAAPVDSSMTGRGRRELLGVLDDPFLGDMLGRAADVAAWAALEDEEGDEGPAPTDLARFMTGAALHALSRDDVGLAADMVARASSADGGTGRIMRELRSRLVQEKGLSVLARALERRARSQPEGAREAEAAGVRYLTSMGHEVASGVCQFYPSVQHEGVRAALTTYLRAVVHEQANAVEGLTRQSDPTVVREAVGVLAHGAATDALLLERLRQAADDVTHAVRAQLATEAVDELTGERERRELLGVVAVSGDRGLRLAALARLRSCGTARTALSLAELAVASGLIDLDAEEAAAFLETMSQLGRLRVVRALQDLADRKAWLIKRQQTRVVAELARARLEELKREEDRRA